MKNGRVADVVAACISAVILGLIKQGVENGRDKDGNDLQEH